MKNVIKLIMATIFVTFTSNASAIPIATVGSYDNLEIQATLANSGNAETSWVETYLGTGYSYNQLSTGGAVNWESVTGGVAGDYAFDFGIGADPEYFLVKVGGGGGTGTGDTHFLFENVNSLQWAFVNLSTFGSGVSLTNFGIISHVGTAGGGTTVPEPGIVGLLAIGLLGVVAARRKMKV